MPLVLCEVCSGPRWAEVVFNNSQRFTSQSRGLQVYTVETGEELEVPARWGGASGGQPEAGE